MSAMFWQRSPLPTVSFATCCWERDWRLILLDPDYLKVKQIENHAFPFQERLLIINNVKDLAAVKKAAQARIDEGVLTRYLVAEEMASESLSFFRLKRSDFRPVRDAFSVNSDWIYYNALGPLSAIYACQADYLLYLTGDVRLEEKIDWIGKSLRKMEKNPRYKVANLTWNGRFDEARRESYKKGWNFFTAKQGFSDQLFLVKRSDFRQPIYGEIRADSAHYPRGDVFEKRVFSYMKNRDWERITYRHGSYIHQNI
jgi:hypothetical protein